MYADATTASSFPPHRDLAMNTNTNPYAPAEAAAPTLGYNGWMTSGGFQEPTVSFNGWMTSGGYQIPEGESIETP
jgi:hypothetical protein